MPETGRRDRAEGGSPASRQARQCRSRFCDRRCASSWPAEAPQDSPRRPVYRSADEPDAADARKDCGNVIRAGATWRKRKAMIRTRLLSLALVVALVGAGGIVQASAEDNGPAAGWHHKHDAAFQPKDFCLNRFARTAAHLA